MISDLEEKIGYRFKDRGWLEQALTHASDTSTPLSYERLEFLGDRVLGLVAADMLLSAFPDEHEGDLAKRHTALVKKETLVLIADTLSLGDYIKLSTSEDVTGGRKKAAILSDVVEGIIGAIYRDGGFAPAAWFVEKFLEPYLHSFAKPPEDPKTALQEWAQARGLPLPVYDVISEIGPSHEPVFEVSVLVETVGMERAQGSSKKAAEKEAATKILQKAMGRTS